MIKNRTQVYSQSRVEAESMQVDVSELANGMYILTISSNTISKTHTHTHTHKKRPECTTRKYIHKRDEFKYYIV